MFQSFWHFLDRKKSSKLNFQIIKFANFLKCLIKFILKQCLMLISKFLRTIFFKFFRKFGKLGLFLLIFIGALMNK